MLRHQSERPNGTKLIGPTNRVGKRDRRLRQGWQARHAVVSPSLYNEMDFVAANYNNIYL